MVLVFLTLPVLAIFVRSPPSQLIEALGEPVAREALLLSLETTTIAVAAIVLIGTPAAWLLATRRLPGRDAMLTLIELPLVLPPAVAGIALLAALGPQGILGGLLSDLHIELVLQTAGVVVALAFVASPFYIRQAHAVLRGDRPQLPGGIGRSRRRRADARCCASRCRSRGRGCSSGSRWPGAERSASSARR